MSTTRQDLRNLIRRRLGDTSSPYHWSDLQINQWINDALADISLHFPRTLDSTLNCSAGEHTCELPLGFLGMLSVEYPSGEDPPRYLARRSYQQAPFWEQDGYYDILTRSDQTDAPELWLSAEPSDGESIHIHYQAEHAMLDDDSDLCTLPDRYLELVVMFVRWASYQELASTESADPDPTNLALGTLELNAYRAKREYRIKIEEWKAAESHSAITRWTMDKWDRAY